MKKALKLTLTLLLAAALLIPPVLAATLPEPSAAAIDAEAAAADAREEVVYANLSADGAVKDVYVVAILSLNEGGFVVDYGGFSSVKNLTTTDDLALSGDTVSLDAPTGDFYYQGTIQNAELPWLVDVQYYLDGALTPADELAGKTGKVSIDISTQPNPNADASFFDNYLLQISVTLDNSKFENITAPDGTIANAGSDKLINFTVMPGDSAELSVKADATDFSMDGIEFAALPMSLSIDTPDTTELSDDLTSLSEAISTLNDAVGELYSGAYDLKNGANDLKSGSSTFAAGLSSLNSSSSDLVSGSSEIMNALTVISASLDGSSGELDLTALSQLPDTFDQLAGGINSISAGMTDLNTAFSAAYAALDAAIGEIPDEEISQQDLMTLYQNNPDQKDTLDKLSAYYAAAANVKGTYAAVQEAFDAVESGLAQSSDSLDEISGSLTTIAEQLRTALSGNETATMMLELSAGLQALSSNYEDFHAGLVDYTSGVSSLAYSYSQMNAGISDLSGGVGQLYDGIGQLYDGTTELNDETADIPDAVDDQLQDFISDYDKSGFTPVSFASDKNINTTSVQFVLKTEKIEIAEPATETAQDEPEPENFWTRLIALFQ